MNTADMLIYVHPEIDADARTNLERRIMGCIGVDCAEFAHQEHHHTLLVKYDPDTVEGKRILDMVREVDPEASRVGL